MSTKPETPVEKAARENQESVERAKRNALSEIKRLVEGNIVLNLKEMDSFCLLNGVTHPNLLPEDEMERMRKVQNKNNNETLARIQGTLDGLPKYGG